jgi:hypothetical protein
MSRNSPLVLILLLGALAAPASAQLTPPAGSAGAGNSAISGVLFGPANPSVLSDPSGIGMLYNKPYRSRTCAVTCKCLAPHFRNWHFSDQFVRADEVRSLL